MKSLIILVLVLVLFLIIINIPLLGPADYKYSIYDRNISNIYSKVIGCDKNIHKENLYTADNILKKHNLDYNLSDGTALGSIRENNIIEGDEDVDLELDVVSIHKFKDTISDFKKEGFKITRFWINEALRGKRINLISMYRNFHYIDFQFSEYGKYCISVSDKPPRLCDEFLKLKEPYNISHISDRKFKTPSINYIEFLYGKDWKTPKNKFKPEDIKR